MSQSREDMESRRMEKMDTVIERMVESHIRTEELLKSTVSRSAEHDDFIKELNKSEALQNKILDQLSIKFNIVQWFIITVLVALITYLVPHFVK